jgi:hypothetical protein
MAAIRTTVIAIKPQRQSSPHEDDTDAGMPQRLVTHRAKWALLKSGFDAVVGDDAPDWFNLEAHRGARRVKAGHYRSVWRVKTPHGTFYCKVFERNREQSWLLRSLVPHPAVREWHMALAARLRGVSVVEVVALGIGRSSWRGSRRNRATSRRLVLITAAFEPSSALSTACPPGKSRHSTIKAVAKLFAEAHARGFVHHDGHPGNVLVRELHGSFEARFLDVHSARFFAGPIPRRIAIRAMGKLDHYFEARATAHKLTRGSESQASPGAMQPSTSLPLGSNVDRLRFLKAYLNQLLNGGSSHHTPNHQTLKHWTRAIQHESHRQGVQLAWQRDRRLHRNGRYFARVDLDGGWRGTVVLALGRRHIFPESIIPDLELDQWLLALPTNLSEISRCSYSTDAPSMGHAEWSHVAECRVGHTDAVMFVQHPIRSSIKAALFGSDARRIFEHAHRLRHRDIAAPLVLGYLEHKSYGMTNACALILPSIKHGE